MFDVSSAHRAEDEKPLSSDGGGKLWLLVQCKSVYKKVIVRAVCQCIHYESVCTG